MFSNVKKIMSFVLALVMLVSLTAVLGGCGGGGAQAQQPVGERTVIKFWPSGNQYTVNKLNELVTAYNDGQGMIDGVFVQADLTKKDVSSNHYSICPENVRNQADILSVSDRNIFLGASYSSGSFYTDLSALYADESLRTKDADGNYVMNIEDFAQATIQRFYFNRENGEAGNMATGTLYALPQETNPTLLMYNENYFVETGINIISVSEEDLAAYNQSNGTSYAPRGYCEYTVEAAPATGLKTSKNLAGETVVKVFNNQIPMNYVELNTLSKGFSKSYTGTSPSTYGFLNEWWFSHCWPVGGNCVAWDTAKQQHVYTLGDMTPGYMVVKAVTINGAAYEPGDVLGYNARAYVAANQSSVDMTALHQLPSQYEQFRDFCALSQKTDKQVDGTTYGYGISPDPNSFSNSSKIKYFTSGQVAMLVEAYQSLHSITESTTAKINVAPLYTFREFEGEDVLGSSELKVVGKEYDGVVFKAELKQVEGVTIACDPVGSSDNVGYAIPANSTKKEAAWKFLQYLCSEEAQKIMCTAQSGATTITAYALSEDYENMADPIVENYAAVGMMAVTCPIGDWSYLGDKEWINDWSVDLNGPVRNGLKTLDAFFETWNPKINGEEQYDKALDQDKYMKIKWVGLQ